MGYWPIQCNQLLFLHTFYTRKGTPEKFDKFLSKISPDYETDSLEQIIKCETHNTPWDLFLGRFVAVNAMNEIRRYLEDTLHEKGVNSEEDERYYDIAKRMVHDHFTSRMIYQFRRFVKCSIPLNIDEIEKLYSYILDNKIDTWLFINSFFDVYSNNKECFWKFLECDKTKDFIIRYNKTCDEDEQYYIYLDFMQYIDDFLV